MFVTADGLNEIRFLNLHDENNFFYAQVTTYERETVFDYEIRVLLANTKGIQFWQW